MKKKLATLILIALLTGCSTVQMTRVSPDGPRLEATAVSIGPADSYKLDTLTGFEVNGQKGIDLDSLATIVRALIAAGVVAQ